MRILSLFLLFFSSAVFAGGSFKLFQKGMTGTGLSFARDVYVYLPPEYEASTHSYPVLFMHDGQNLFDPSRAVFGITWNAEKTLNDLILRKIIRPIIVVAIDNTPDRSGDYIPEKNGDLYLKFILRNLRPLLERTFRTKKGRENTGLMGSSLGGLISLHAGVNFSGQFGLIAALSPSIWWNNASILKRVQNSSSFPLRLYVDSGSIDGERPEDVLALEQILLERGLTPDVHFQRLIEAGAGHNERAWARRFPLALEFLFPSI